MNNIKDKKNSRIADKVFQDAKKDAGYKGKKNKIKGKK